MRCRSACPIARRYFAHVCRTRRVMLSVCMPLDGQKSVRYLYSEYVVPSLSQLQWYIPNRFVRIGANPSKRSDLDRCASGLSTQNTKEVPTGGIMGKNHGAGFFSCLCRPRYVDGMGVVSSNSTMHSVTNNKQRGDQHRPTFMDELAAGSFNPADDVSFFPNDDTEPTLEEEYLEAEVVVEDPFEKSYRFWYAKGILSFVPRSIQEQEVSNNGTDEDSDWAKFPSKQSASSANAAAFRKGNTATAAVAAREQTKQAKTLLPPPRSASPANPKRVSPLLLKQRQSSSSPTGGANALTLDSRTLKSGSMPIASPPFSSSRGERSLPREVNKNKAQVSELPDVKPRSSSQTPFSNTKKQQPPSRSTTKRQEDCASCGSVVVTRVRCVQCKETVYCSMFCRGNDRYKHASVCSQRVCAVAATTGAVPSPTKKPTRKTKLVDAADHPTAEPKLQPSLVKRTDFKPEAHALRRYREDRSKPSEQ
jgi:MYND finger